LEGDKVINVGPDEKGTAVYSALSEKLLPNTETPAAGAILCGDLLTVTGKKSVHLKCDFIIQTKLLIHDIA
jgi:hypothetical protein